MAASAPSSEVDICNLALDLLNQKAITSIDAPTNSAEEICARWYHQIRRAVLRKHPWNFASKRDAWAEVDVEIAFGYENAYALASDFVRLVSIGDDVNGSGLTNEDGELLVRYVYDITNVSQFDALFIDLLVIELALAMAQKFTASETRVEQLREMLKLKAPVAYSVDGQERPPTRYTRSRWISRRTRGRMGNVGSQFVTFDGEIPSPVNFQVENGYILTGTSE